MTMAILRFLGLVLTGTIGGATLVVAVTVLLGVGWLAVAVPVLVVAGVAAAGATIWRRVAGPRER